MAKFIRFDDYGEIHEGKPVIEVVNKRANDSIAQIFWYAPWRQWACRFKPDSVWSQDCLADVREYMLGLAKGK